MSKRKGRIRYAPEFRRQMVELVRAGAHAGRAGARVRAHSEHDPEMGRAAGPGRGIARGWANERGAD